MKKERIACLLLSILVCCFLSGCGNLLKNEQMDREVEHLIKALNEDDADEIFLSLYPDVVTREEFDEAYKSIRKIWKKSDSYTMKLNSINTQKNYSNSGDSLIYKAQYYIYMQDNAYTFDLTYLSDGNGDGLYGFYINIGAGPMLISGSFTTARENSVLQWGILLLGVLFYLLIIVTVVDILRKRPRLFGLWLVAALTFFSFQFKIMQDNFYAGVSVNWFVISAYKIYNNDSWTLFLALPAGAIVYWCLRKKLLIPKIVKTE